MNQRTKGGVLGLAILALLLTLAPDADARCGRRCRRAYRNNGCCAQTACCNDSATNVSDPSMNRDGSQTRADDMPPPAPSIAPQR